LWKEKSLVRNLKNKMSRLQRIMEEKERYLESSIYEQNKLVQQYRKAADDKKKHSEKNNYLLQIR
jgi:hypothetical protein